MKKVSITIVGVLLLCMLGYFGWRQASVPSRSDFVRRINLLTLRDPEAAVKMAEEALSYFPADMLLEIARVEAQIAAGDSGTAVEWCDAHRKQLIDSSTTISERLLTSLLNNGSHVLGEQLLNHRLDSAPADVIGLRIRAGLRLSHGRMDEARSDLQALLELQQLLIDELVFLCSRREFLEDKKGLEKALQVSPGNSSVLTGLGALAAFEGDRETASSLLQQAVKDAEAPAAAWREIGRLYFREGRINEIFTWKDQQPERCRALPDVKFVIAWGLFQRQQYRDALGELSQVLRSDPLHREALQLVAQILTEQQVGSEFPKAFSLRAKAVHELEELSHLVLFGNREVQTLSRCAQLCAELGEADLTLAWLRFAEVFARRTGQRWQQADIAKNASETANEANQVLAALLQRIDEDQFGVENDVAIASNRPQGASQNPIKFVDIAGQVGMDQNYFGGLESLNSGIPIAFGFGGGVAVFDFDLDDQPDFYFTQGNSWPLRASLPLSEQDLLYRQRDGRVDLLQANVLPSEAGLGQGVAVGDVDADGFPDLYVANIGPNRILLNNGDGTFEAIDMPPSDPSSPSWTTSCLLADLNSDGIDDLYDCHYASGSTPFERECLSGPNGEERGCSPTLFQPESDRVLLGRGEGGFTDVSVSSGLSGSAGRGLGVLLANLDDDPGLELFVSNDMTNNHLWLVSNSKDGLRLNESATMKGLAANGVGQVEASMGIAAADFSGDGRTDLHVTNFFEETNTFYQSQSGGFFRDQSQVSQLAAPSLKLLGFGCQPLDADLDSDFDLLIVNGHVDDYRHRDIPWKMCPALYQNLGGAEFEGSKPDDLGEYGQQPSLGRACARLDYDRDGKPDAVITHLDRSPALLLNQTKDCGGSLTVRCIGDVSNRPAVGVAVTARIGDRFVFCQRKAGDGYYCSNEWNLIIGVGAAKTIDRLELTWPSGQQQAFKNVSVKRRISIVEGEDRLFEMRP